MTTSSNTVALRDVVQITHGFAFKGEFFSNDPPGDILLTPGYFAVGGGFKGDKLKYYIGSVPEDYVLNEGDLIVTMTDLSKGGDTLGYPAIVPKQAGGRFLHNQRLGRVIIEAPERLDKDYLYFVMCSASYRHEVLASATGTTVKHTSPDRILNYQALLPPLTEQKRIAHILGSLDDKIELNRRMNETLEQMARALFKSWFVDFDPVRWKKEGKDPCAPVSEGGLGLNPETAALFPDKLIPSALGMIPEGWEFVALDDIAVNVRKVVMPQELADSTPYIGLEHLPRGSISLEDWGTAGSTSSGKFRFSNGDILFGKLRPYFHKVGIAPIEGICSTDVLVIQPINAIMLDYVLLVVSSKEFVDYSHSGSSGTKMPRTSWKYMSKYIAVLPPEELIGAFTSIAKPSINRIVIALHESRALACLRDVLLPKLISGNMVYSASSDNEGFDKCSI